MKTRIVVLAGALVLASLVSASLASASSNSASPAHAEGSTGKKESASATVAYATDVDGMRLRGEQRYRANCGRCHAAPRKFPPRMMATVLRHMRVRATITDEDMRLVLFYMTQ